MSKVWRVQEPGAGACDERLQSDVIARPVIPPLFAGKSSERRRFCSGRYPPTMRDIHLIRGMSSLGGTMFCVVLLSSDTRSFAAKIQRMSEGTAGQYRLKAQHYRASAEATTDPNRREAFELLAEMFDRLAAAYERIQSS